MVMFSFLVFTFISPFEGVVRNHRNLHNGFLPFPTTRATTSADIKDIRNTASSPLVFSGEDVDIVTQHPIFLLPIPRLRPSAVVFTQTAPKKRPNLLLRDRLPATVHEEVPWLTRVFKFQACNNCLGGPTY